VRSNIFLVFLITITIISASANNENNTSNQLNDERQLVTYTGYLAGGTIAIGIATIITLILSYLAHRKQIAITDKQNKITALMEIFKTMSDEEHRIARSITYQAKREYDKTGDIEVFNIRTRYKEVGITASHFNQIGELIKKNIIPKEEFLDLHADTTILCWKSLKDYVKNQQEKRKSTFYMNQFVWLGEQAEIYWKENRPNDPYPELY